MVLQNQAPSTLDKYICKLAENILIDFCNGLSINELEDEINNKFGLSFTVSEIKSALNKKSNKTVKYNDEKYYIDSSTRDDLLKQEPLTDILDKYVLDFIKANPEIEIEPSEVSAILLNYLYFCFNSNVKNLLMLLNKGDNNLQFADDVKESEIRIINAFLSWNNDEKNEFIYRIVATCYEYCMLTVKNDNVISKELFKGKKFYLDSNIIFRMAGINKDDRKISIDSFIEQCKKIGINLCCTSVTVDEIYRVLESQINYIRGNYSDAPPVSPKSISNINSYYDVNDFYTLYYDWCQIKGNHFTDLQSFYEYLFELVRGALEKVDIIPITMEKYIREKDFIELSNSLRDYKNQHNSWRFCSSKSSETDIINIKEIYNKRSKNQESIWQANEFIVSADQLLIAWSTENYSGVPIVVLPSVWLSIILRFTGRSNDDYNSFCLFLTQRQRRNPDNQINPETLIKKINQRTSETYVRERIIEEITKHKNDFSFDDDSDYDLSIDKAFDIVLKQIKDEAESDKNEYKQKLDNELQKANANHENALRKQQSEADALQEIERAAERDKTVLLLSKEKVAKRVNRYKWIKENRWIYFLVGVVFAAFFLVCILTKWEPFWEVFLSVLDEKRFTESQLNIIMGVFSVLITLLAECLIGILDSLGNESREKKLLKKYQKKIRKSLEAAEKLE